MLNDEEKMESLRLMEEFDRRKCLNSLSRFSEEAWPLIEPKRRFVPGWHIDAISEHLEAVARGEIRNLLINIPPRHSKSSLVCVFFPAWVWLTRPESRWLFASYSQNLSKRDSVKCRRIIESEWYRKKFMIDWELAGDQNEKMKFQNTREGYRLATSVGGTATGEGGDFLVCDDPHKALEVHSETKRNRVLEWWDEEMSTRANDPKTFSKIIVMQRLHDRDLSGHVLSKDDYEHLCLPAEYEPRVHFTSLNWSDPRKEEGELLWPERFGKKEIDALKSELGSMAAAGQLQQRPAPAEGNIVRRNWWRFYNRRPEKFDKIIQAWDLTFKDSEHGDWCVGTCWGSIGAEKYLLDMTRERLSFTSQLSAVQNFKNKWPDTRAIYVESAANGEALIDTLKKKIPGIMAVPPRGSKMARAQAISPQIEAGQIYLPSPESAPWVSEFIEEWAIFPNGHDDIVDSSTYGITQLTQTVNFDWAPISMTKESSWK